MSGRRQNWGQGASPPHPVGHHHVGGRLCYVDERGRAVLVQDDAGTYQGTDHLGPAYQAAPQGSGGARMVYNATPGRDIGPNPQDSAVGVSWEHGSGWPQQASSSSTTTNSGGWAYGNGGSQPASPSSTTANWGSLGSSSQGYPPDDMGTRSVPDSSHIRTTSESVTNYNWHIDHFMTTPSSSVQVRNHHTSGVVPAPDSMGRVNELFPGGSDHSRLGEYPGSIDISSSDTDEGDDSVVEGFWNESKGKAKSKPRSSRSSRSSKSSKRIG